MSLRIGYLLPTRERITAGQPQAVPLLELAERAERLGFDSSAIFAHPATLIDRQRGVEANHAFRSARPRCFPWLARPAVPHPAMPAAQAPVHAGGFQRRALSNPQTGPSGPAPARPP